MKFFKKGYSSKGKNHGMGLGYIKQVVQTDRSVEITLPEELSNSIKADKLLIEAMNLSRSFNIKYVNKRISILLYTKDLPKHFIFYIVTLLEKIL